MSKRLLRSGGGDRRRAEDEEDEEDEEDIRARLRNFCRTSNASPADDRWSKVCTSRMCWSRNGHVIVPCSWFGQEPLRQDLLQMVLSTSWSSSAIAGASNHENGSLFIADRK